MNAEGPFVILLHRLPPGPRRTHWDLLLDLDPDQPLTTFALSDEPGSPGVGEATRLPPHRRRYLHFEGPLEPRDGADRGEVRQWARGRFTFLRHSGDVWRLRLQADDGWDAILELTSVDAAAWRAVWTAP